MLFVVFVEFIVNRSKNVDDFTNSAVLDDVRVFFYLSVVLFIFILPFFDFYMPVAVIYCKVFAICLYPCVSESFICSICFVIRTF